MSSPRWDDEEAFEDDPRPRSPRTRYVRDDGDDLPRPVREVLEPEPEPRYHGFPSEREESRFRWGPVLAALVVGFVLAILFGPRRSADPAREEQIASLEAELQSARDRVGHGSFFPTSCPMIGSLDGATLISVNGKRTRAPLGWRPLVPARPRYNSGQAVIGAGRSEPKELS